MSNEKLVHDALRSHFATDMAAWAATQDVMLALTRPAQSVEQATIETLRRERDEALREASKQARAAGEAIGKLEVSEMAGIVEGWIERAKKAERERDEARERAAGLEAREVVVRAKALEEAEITACEAFDVMTTARPMPNLRNHIRRSIRALAESEASDG